MVLNTFVSSICKFFVILTFCNKIDGDFSMILLYPYCCSICCRNFNSQMDKAGAILFLTVLLASTLYPETTLAKAKSIRVYWSEETHGRWFPIGTIFHAGDSIGDSHHSSHCLITLTSIFQLLMHVNAITPI